jgi:hypothetical protein
VATGWQAAHVAHQAASDFLYVVGADEIAQTPVEAALADQAMRFATAWLFLGRPLQLAFGAPARSAVLEPPLPQPVAPSAADLARRARRRAVLDCRGDVLLELAVEALDVAPREPDWELMALWDSPGRSALPLAGGRRLESVGPLDAEQTQALFGACDLGVVLRPGDRLDLEPLRMAGAGMVVVTLGDERLTTLSANLVPCEAAPASLADGLRRAAEMAEQGEARAAGSEIAWAHSWREAFTPALLNELTALLGRAY